MKYYRHYEMNARDGREAELSDALRCLRHMIEPIEGCLGTEILQNEQQKNCFLFVECWLSHEAWQASGDNIKKDAFGAVKRELAGIPIVYTFTGL